jgi:DNA repair exonuclease SbcCD nuclease subunit
MLVAVTADLHLTSRETHPERFRALEDVLKQMVKNKMDHLIIAGDLFNQDTRNTAEFETVCREHRHRSIHFHILPGNHDSRLTAKSFTTDNVTVYSEPELKEFDLLSLSILFMPYQKDKNMGEALAAFESRCRPNQWILVGHGDWTGTLREPNPAEPGLYMPMTRVDVETLKPASVILGHVHKSFDHAVVHIPGSPCGLDITETGRRRFFVLDTETGGVKPIGVDTDVLFFDETVVVLPAEDEEKLVRASLEVMVKAWGTTETEKKKASLRLRVAGYTSDKQKLAATVAAFFKGVRFYQGGEPDLSAVSVSDDVERADLAERVRKQIASMPWPQGTGAPTKDEAFIHALRVIYEA